LRPGLARPSWRSWTLAAAALAVVLTLVAMVLMSGRPRTRAAGAGAGSAFGPGSDRFYVGGLDYEAYDGGNLVVRARADQVIHRKRKVGPLTLNPVKEVEIDGLRIDLFPRSPETGRRSQAPPAYALDRLLRDLLESKHLGFVSRVTLRDLAVEDRSAPGEVLRFSAEEAIWHPGGKRLDVHGRFEHQDGTGIQRGTDRSFRLTEEGRLVPVP